MTGIGRVRAVRRAWPLDELEDQTASAVSVHHAINGANMRMIEGRQQSRLSLEPCEPLRIGGEIPWQDLDRDVAAQRRIRRTINLPHSSFADRRMDFVDAKTGAGTRVKCVDYTEKRRDSSLCDPQNRG